MKSNTIIMIGFSVGLVFSVAARADELASDQYKFLEKNIETEYQAAEQKCGLLSGNERAICSAEAKGNRGIAKAELDASNKPSVQTRYDANAASIDAAYSVAILKCNDRIGDDQIACIEDAKTAKSEQLAEAMRQIRDSKPDEVANKRR